MIRDKHYTFSTLRDSSTTFFLENRRYKTLDIGKHRETWKELFDWLADKKVAKLKPIDNVAYSDVDEDSYIGWRVSFENDADAMLFKLVWS